LVLSIAPRKREKVAPSASLTGKLRPAEGRVIDASTAHGAVTQRYAGRVTACAGIP